MTETLIKIENLHKSFGKNEVLRGINLEIKEVKLWLSSVLQGAGNLQPSLYEFVWKKQLREGYL